MKNQTYTAPSDVAPMSTAVTKQRTCLCFPSCFWPGCPHLNTMQDNATTDTLKEVLEVFLPMTSPPLPKKVKGCVQSSFLEEFIPSLLP